MAHKVRSDYYVRLHRLLEQTGLTYAVYLSTALHENTSFDEAFGGAFAELSSIFGDALHFVGFLSDAAVYNYLRTCTYFTAFFERGARSNNTSVNAAMACGAVVITNLDDYSPPAFQHAQNLLDINALEALPLEPVALARIGRAAQRTSQQDLSWDGLIRTLTAGSRTANGLVAAPGGQR
jgi:hypothetical protein